MSENKLNNTPPHAQRSARRDTKRVITIERWNYLYKVTLVALVTRGNETVHFAFDLVLLVILFWGRSAQRLLFWGKGLFSEQGGNRVVAVYLVWLIPFG